MANVEIFRTNITNKRSAKSVVEKLSERFPMLKFNVDLHDAEKILRMEGDTCHKKEVQQITVSLGFICEEISA